MSVNEIKTFAVKQAGFEMVAELHRASQDITILLTGGDVPHYGVTTVVSANQVLQSYRFASRPGHHHEEYVLTEHLGKIIQPALQGNGIIIAGVHVNDITSEQMKATFKMTDELGQQIKKWLLAHPVAKPHETFAK